MTVGSGQQMAALHFTESDVSFKWTPKGPELGRQEEQEAWDGFGAGSREGHAYLGGGQQGDC